MLTIDQAVRKKYYPLMIKGRYICMYSVLQLFDGKEY